MNADLNTIIEFFDNLIKIDGFDDCIIGVCESLNEPPRLIYNRDLIIQKLIDRDKMTTEEAIDFYEFNIRGSWMGDTTPIFLIITCNH